VRVSLGGVRDEAELAATGGRISARFRPDYSNDEKSGTTNPIFVLDEVTRCPRTSRRPVGGADGSA